MKCRDNLSTVSLHSALFLLRHNSNCCNKFLQVALDFCCDIHWKCHDISAFSALANFAYFSTFLAYFALKTCKTQIWVKIPYFFIKLNFKLSNMNEKLT